MSVNIESCPFCGSTNLHTSKGFSSGDNSEFLPRHGCLSCNEWLGPVILLDKRDGIRYYNKEFFKSR